MPVCVYLPADVPVQFVEVGGPELLLVGEEPPPGRVRQMQLLQLHLPLHRPQPASSSQFTSHH